MPSVKLNKQSHEQKPDFPWGFFHRLRKHSRHVVTSKKKKSWPTQPHRVSFPSRNLRQRLQYASSQPATPNKCTFSFFFLLFLKRLWVTKSNFFYRLHSGHRAERAAEADAWLLGVPPTHHLQRREDCRRRHQRGALLERTDPGEVSTEMESGGGRGWWGSDGQR